MKTIEGASLAITPGERAVLYMPIPQGTAVDALDVDPATAAAFRIERADVISREACLQETGTPGPAVRLALENVSGRPAVARMFVDVGIAQKDHQSRLERAAAEWNRTAHALRTAPTEAERRLVVAQIMASRRQRVGQA